MPYHVDIEIPYVEERKTPYSAPIFRPYEVVTEEERILYELEEFVVTLQVPRVVANTVQVPTIDQSLVTV